MKSLEIHLLHSLLLLRISARLPWAHVSDMESAVSYVCVLPGRLLAIHPAQFLFLNITSVQLVLSP